MSVSTDGAATTVAPSATDHAEEGFAGWDLDVSIIESGPEADRLIQMTDDGCGATCESACSTTCP